MAVKEAVPRYRRRYHQHGERVVQGQRLTQAAGDVFLGWTKGLDTSRNFYWRQLRDMKVSALVELMAPITLTYDARLCGWTLAQAHARAGDPVAMAEDLAGKAVRSGRLGAVEGV